MKRQVSARSLSNLKPVRKGEVRNPEGINHGKTLFRIPEVVQKIKKMEALTGMEISLVEFEDKSVRRQDYGRFAPIVEALKESLDKGKVVRIDFGTVLEAMEAQKWALGLGEFRRDAMAIRKKSECGFCISSRSRANSTLFLRAKKL